MSEYTVSRRLRVSGRGAEILIFVSYAILGSILCWTRLAGLDRSYWHDEIVTVRDFVNAGPQEILAGDRLNHELLSLVAWATASLGGESEIALRLSSVIPFIVGVIVVTTWLHIRVGALSGVMFLFLASVSPLLLDLSRQARGYGLAFFAMSALVVSALEAERKGRTREVIMFCAAGVIGTWTLPNFGIAFLATGIVLLANANLRRRAAVGLGASILAIGAWYAPHFSVVSESSRQEYGVQLDLIGVVRAPFDQILLPALLRFDGNTPISSPAWLPLIALIVLPISASPLLHWRRTSLILVIGVATSIVSLWATGTHTVPRFLSFLLVPLLMLLASGVASILARLSRRPPIVRTVVALTMLIVLAGPFVSNAAQVTQLPREAHKDAAATIRAHASTAAPVFAYMPQPGDLAFYLERPLTRLRKPEAASRVCELRQGAVLVVHPWRLAPLDLPCFRRIGTRHYRLEQYARGGEMSVYFIPGTRR